jgi:putative membrane protein
LGGAGLIALIAWFGGQAIGGEVLRAGWAIPANIVIHALQLLSAACAWRLVVGEPGYSPFAFLRFRTIREGVNSLLPVAQIGGPVVAVRVMIASGMNGAIAGAGTTLDLTIEATMQLVYTMIGIAVLRSLGIDPAWARWVEGGLASGAIGVVLFVLAQRAGLMRVIERLLGRLQRLFPKMSLDSLQGLHRELMRLQENPWVLVQAALFQLGSWCGGMFEVYLALLAMGHPVSFGQAFVIECLGMAARSAGFAVPGALGIQEGGFILVCGLFGISPDTGLALSMVKRLREVMIGSVGLMMWQWTEIKNWLKKGKEAQ